MNADTTPMRFTCELVTIRSKTFNEVTAEIERVFQCYDSDKLRDLTAAGDAEGLSAYARQIGEPTGFGIFYQLDMGSIMKLAGIPIESRFYLFGDATTGQELFRHSGTAGLGAPTRFCVIAARWRRNANRYRSAKLPFVSSVRPAEIVLT